MSRKCAELNSAFKFRFFLSIFGLYKRYDLIRCFLTGMVCFEHFLVIKSPKNQYSASKNQYSELTSPIVIAKLFYGLYFVDTQSLIHHRLQTILKNNINQLRKKEDSI